MNNREVKIVLDKFRNAATKHSGLNLNLQANIKFAFQYCEKKNYILEDFSKKEKDIIVEIADQCFNMFIQVYGKTDWDVSVYAICSLGAAYGVDRYMTSNNMTKIIHPLQKIKNGGFSDNDLGEIESFKYLWFEYGKPRGL